MRLGLTGAAGAASAAAPARTPRSVAQPVVAEELNCLEVAVARHLAPSSREAGAGVVGQAACWCKFKSRHSPAGSRNYPSMMQRACHTVFLCQLGICDGVVLLQASMPASSWVQSKWTQLAEHVHKPVHKLAQTAVPVVLGTHTDCLNMCKVSSGNILSSRCASD